MPRRAYRIYPDSTVLSVAADPRTKNNEAKRLLQEAKRFCTLVYSEVTVSENGPENCKIPRLGRLRLALLKGKNCERISLSKATISLLAWQVLAALKLTDKRTTSLQRDAQHLAAAVLGHADILVTANLGDFNTLRAGMLTIISQARIPAIVTLPEASRHISENPKRTTSSDVFKNLYARQQYWSMRDNGYGDKVARQYIERKWHVKLPRRFP
jgi:hypothetical protein